MIPAIPYEAQLATRQLESELDTIDRQYRRLLSEQMPDVRRRATFIAWGFDRYRAVKLFGVPA